MSAQHVRDAKTTARSTDAPKSDLQTGVDYLVSAAQYRLHKDIELSADLMRIQNLAAVSRMRRSLGQRFRWLA